MRRARGLPLTAWLYTQGKGNVGAPRKGWARRGRGGEGEGGREREPRMTMQHGFVITPVGSRCRARPWLCSSRSSHSVRVIRDVYASWMILPRYQWAALSLECELLGSGEQARHPVCTATFQKCVPGAFCTGSLTPSFLDRRALCTLTSKSCFMRSFNCRNTKQASILRYIIRLFYFYVLLFPSFSLIYSLYFFWWDVSFNIISICKFAVKRILGKKI